MATATKQAVKAATSKPAQGVTVKAPNAVAVQDNVPEYIKRGAGRGNENVEMADVVIPRIEIAQALSPCIDKKKDAYIDGCEAGNLYNTVTRELYGDEVTVVPVLFKKEYLVWKDRKKGGGFRGAHPSMTEAQVVIDREETPEDFMANETAQQMVYVLHEDGRCEEAVVSMAKTKLKVSRQWNSLIRINGLDRFSRQYKLFSVDDKNADGEEYKNFGILNAGFPPEDVYKRAETLYTAIASGARKMVYDTSDDAAEAVATESTEY